MGNEDKGAPAQQQPTPPAPPAAKGDDQQGQMIPKARLDEVIGQREEYKTKLANLEKTVADLQAASQKQQEAQLAEQGKFKELYEKQKAETDSLKLTETKYNDLLKKQADVNKAKREAIPEKYRDMLAPAMSDPIAEAEYLDRFIGKLPELGAKVGQFPGGPKPVGGGSPDEELTAMEAEYNSLAGKTDAQSQVRRLQLKEQIFNKRRAKP